MIDIQNKRKSIEAENKRDREHSNSIEERK